MPYVTNPTTGRQEYKDLAGNQYIEDGVYALDENQKPYYPHNVDLHEFMDPNLKLINRDGGYVYPLKKTGEPNYRKEGTGADAHEVYEEMDGKWIMGKGKSGDEYYALDKNNNDYYPEDNQGAKKSDGSYFYAVNRSTHVTIFPTDKSINKNEYYLTDIDPSKPHTIPTRYAIEDGLNEIYPIRKTSDGLSCQHILNDTYALRDRKAYYPRDGNNNEYYSNQPAAANVLLEAYAVTNDGKVILPTVSNSAHIEPTKTPAVTQDDVLGKLYRERNDLSNDHLTKVDAPTKPNVVRMRYSYEAKTTKSIIHVIPPSPFYKTWYFWIIVIVSLIIKLFAIWWFFLRNPKIVTVYSRTP